MKTKLFALIVLVIAASCSAPKYTYKFGYYDYQAGKRAALKEAQVVAANQASEVVATTEAAPVVTETVAVPAVETKQEVVAMTKAQQKAFVKEVKKEIKTSAREVKKLNTVQSTQSMDHDLKIAAIFGAIGIVLGALYSVNTIVGFAGFVCIVIALVFLVKWLLRQ